MSFGNTSKTQRNSIYENEMNYGSLGELPNRRHSMLGHLETTRKHRMNRQTSVKRRRLSLVSMSISDNQVIKRTFEINNEINDGDQNENKNEEDFYSSTRALQRNILMSLYQNEESNRKVNGGRGEINKYLSTNGEEIDEGELIDERERRRLVKFLIYMTNEHEIILQIIIFLPLTLMTLYIYFVENGELVRRKELTCDWQ